VSAYETDEYAFATVVDRADEPVFVASDIEDDAVVGNYISAPEHFFDVGRFRPVCCSDNANPCPQWLLGIGSAGACPKFA
jgi:hypothetical protein